MRGCPKCGHTKAAVPLPEARPIRDGDYGVCGGCCSVLRVTGEDAQPVLATHDEIDKLSQQQLIGLAAALSSARATPPSKSNSSNRVNSLPTISGMSRWCPTHMPEQPTPDLLRYYFDKQREIPTLSHNPAKQQRAKEDAQRAADILKKRAVNLE